MKPRSVLLPAAIAVWGVAIVVYRLTASSASHTNGAYHSGQNFGTVIGVVMAVVGTIYFVRALRERG